MKDKAKKIATEWSQKTGVLSQDGTYFKVLCDDIELALMDQERDTRHACAEAVLNASFTHDECMNVPVV